MIDWTEYHKKIVDKERKRREFKDWLRFDLFMLLVVIGLVVFSEIGRKMW